MAFYLLCTNNISHVMYFRVWLGGSLLFEVGYPRKKSRNKGCLFKTRQCTRVHRLGVQNRAKLKKNGCVFGHIDKF